MVSALLLLLQGLVLMVRPCTSSQQAAARHRSASVQLERKDVFRLLALPPPSGTPAFSDSDSCPVCLEDYDDAASGEGAIAGAAKLPSPSALVRSRLHCGHALCVRCTFELISRSAAPTCPLCRDSLLGAGQWQRSRGLRDFGSILLA